MKLGWKGTSCTVWLTDPTAHAQLHPDKSRRTNVHIYVLLITSHSLSLHLSPRFLHILPHPVLRIAYASILLTNRLRIPFYHSKVPVKRQITQIALKYLVSWIVLTGGEGISGKVNIEFIDPFILHKYIPSISYVPGPVLAASDAEMRKS